MEYLIYTFVTILIIVYFVLLTGQKKLSKIELRTFGGNDTISNTSVQFYTQQLKKYSNQQSWSFGLLWAAILASLIMGGVLIYDKLIMNEGNADWLPQAIGLAGGGGVSLTAFRLYKSASKKVDDLILKIAPLK